MNLIGSRSNVSCISAGLLTGVLAVAHAAAAEPVRVNGYDDGVRPLLETHCFGCHGNGAAEGGIDFNTMTSRGQRTFARHVETIGLGTVGG